MLARLRSAINEWGWFGTGLYALGRFCDRISKDRVKIYFYRLEIQPVPQKPLLPPHRGRQFEIRELKPNDASLASIPRPMSVIDERFRQGSVCLGAFNNDQLIGQLWLQFDMYIEDEVRCRFFLSPPTKVVWDYDVFIEPQYRSSFAFARLWDQAFNLLRTRGIEWSASRVSAWNTASLQSHGRLGAREVSCVVFFVVGKLQITLANTRPLIHLSVSYSKLPSITIAAPTSVAPQ